MLFSKMNDIIFKRIILVLFSCFTLFLTFKFLISIDMGFDIRIPHFLFGGLFVFIAFIITLNNHTLYFRELLILICIIILFSVLNLSVKSAYFYYLIAILIINYSIFITLTKYCIELDKVMRIIVYTSLVHLVLSYLTLEKTWYGGVQILSYSDFPTFFSMQLSVIFPFIFLINSKIRKNAILILFVITIFLLAARGPILAMMISYLYVYKKHIKIKYVFVSIILFCIIVLFIMIINYGLIEYFLMKINPFAENYNKVSDMNRWLYIIATMKNSFENFNWLIGSGLKTNANIIYDFFQNHFINDIENFSILEHATVHNLFLELYSDLGIIVFLLFLIIIFNMYKRLNRMKNTSAYIIKVSFLIFIINYNLEPNYIHFFFWFFMFFYQFSIQQLEKKDSK